jgi:hypothetical protein
VSAQPVIRVLDEATEVTSSNNDFQGEENMKQGELINQGAPSMPPASDKGNGLTVRHSEQLTTAPTPMDLLRIATEQGANVDTLAKLLDLQERWEANQARKLFNEALAKFKQNPPQITKNKHVKFGNTEYDHATLDQVSDVIGAALSAVGLRHRWEPQQTGNAISVTCVLEGFGHEERTTLAGPADSSGSKNPIQAIASAVTYLQRYTLLAAVGMAAKGQDDDGTGSGMPDGWLAERLDWIANCNAGDLQKTFAAAWREASKAGATRALDTLLKAKEARLKKEQAA